MLNYIRYEIRSSLGNYATLVFGFVVPLVMTLLMYNANLSLVPEAGHSELANRLFISFMLMIPLANILVGFPTAYAQEIEKDITTRTHLFGYKHKEQIIAKLTAQTLVLFLTIFAYAIIVKLAIPITVPSLYTCAILIISLLLLSTVLFMLAYAVSVLAKRFSITYSITMSLYFLTMILSGMMGLPTKLLPGFVQTIGESLPTTQIIQTLSSLWLDLSTSLMPLIQSFTLSLLLTGVFLYFVVRKKRTA